jgi:hypothetical protein
MIYLTGGTLDEEFSNANLEQAVALLREKIGDGENDYLCLEWDDEE